MAKKKKTKKSAAKSRKRVAKTRKKKAARKKNVAKRKAPLKVEAREVLIRTDYPGPRVADTGGDADDGEPSNGGTDWGGARIRKG